MEYTIEQKKACINAIKAIADCIKELGRIPSGELYARLMPYCSLEEYQKVIDMFKNSKIIREENYELIWNV